MISKERRRKTALVIKRRVRQIFLFDCAYVSLRDIRNYRKLVLNKNVRQKNRLAKKPAFGCSNSRCGCCHWIKISKKNRQYQLGYEDINYNAQVV